MAGVCTVVEYALARDRPAGVVCARTMPAGRGRAHKWARRRAFPRQRHSLGHVPRGRWRGRGRRAVATVQLSGGLGCRSAQCGGLFHLFGYLRPDTTDGYILIVRTRGLTLMRLVEPTGFKLRAREAQVMPCHLSIKSTGEPQPWTRAVRVRIGRPGSPGIAQDAGIFLAMCVLYR